MSKSKSVNLEHAQTFVPCSVCEDEVPGEYYCIECKQTLCAQCEKHHKRVAATKSHTIILRAQVGNIDTTTLTCADHGLQASFHCKKCNIPVCIKCVTGKHQGHKMVDLSRKFEKEKKLVQEYIDKVKKDVLPQLKKKREKIKTEKEKYETKIESISKDMEDEHKFRLADLTRIHDDRLRKLINFRVESVSQFNDFSQEINAKINLCEEEISKYEDAIRKGDITAVENLAKIKIPLPEIGSNMQLPDPPSFVPANVRSTECLGKLHLPSKTLKRTVPTIVSQSWHHSTPTIVSRFKSPFQGSSGIYITREGDVWLGGGETKELIMVGIKGQVLKRRNVEKVPKSLAAMDCGDVIISPRYSRSVSRLLIDDREKHVFDTSPSWCYGVSVTSDQKILICTADGRVVKINGDGHNAKQIYKGSGIDSALHAVENADGNFYIGDSRNRAVVMINKGGQVLSTITHTTTGQQLEKPCGLVVDKMDNVLCADFSNNCVYIIDKNQQIRELVGLSHGIQDPGNLAVDNENNLWVTQRDGHVHVVKYLSP